MEAVVFHGRSIICCDAAETPAAAIAVRGGRVAAIGDLDEVRAAAGTGARPIDVDGTTVLPGLVDTHPHLTRFEVLAEPLIDLSDAVDHRDIVARIAAEAKETPRGDPRAIASYAWRASAERTDALWLC